MKKSHSIGSLNHRRLFLTVFCGLWLAIFLIYALTVSPTASGYADSDELLLMAKTWGVAHPSGFPLIIFITGLLMRALPMLSPALVGNLAAALYQSVSIAALGTSLLVIFYHKRDVLFVLSVIIGSILGALSGAYWLYGTVLEVVSFTNALISLTLLSALLWQRDLHENGTHHQSLFLLTFLLAGLSLSHIHTTILMFPSLLVLLVVAFRDWSIQSAYRRLFSWAQALLTLAMGWLIPNLLLFYFNSRQQMYSWFFEPTLKGWLHFVFRQDYAGYFPEENTSRNAYTAQFLPHFLSAQPEWIKYLLLYLAPVGVILVIVGFIYFFKHSRRYFWVFFTGFLVSGPLFLGYMGFPVFSALDPEYPMMVGVTYRQFLIMHWFVLGLLSLGVYAISLFFKRFLTLRLTFIIITIMGLVMCSGYVYQFYALGNHRTNTIATQYAHQMLSNLKPHSTLICSSDIACFSLFYTQSVEHTRPDVLVLSKNDLYVRRFYQKHPDIYPFLYHDNPFYFADLLSYSLTKGPVYLTNPTQYYIDYIGFDANPFYLIPKGYTYQVVSTVPSNLDPKEDYSLSRALVSSPPPKLDFYLGGLAGYFSTLHETNGILYANFNIKTAAKNNLNLALQLFPQAQNPVTWLNKLDQYNGNPAYLPGSSVHQPSLLRDFEQTMQTGDRDNAYILIRKATYLEPLNSALRWRLITLYQEGGYPEEAITELHHLLTFDPQNASATALLKTLLP